MEENCISGPSSEKKIPMHVAKGVIVSKVIRGVQSYLNSLSEGTVIIKEDKAASKWHIGEWRWSLMEHTDDTGERF